MLQQANKYQLEHKLLATVKTVFVVFIAFVHLVCCWRKSYIERKIGKEKYTR